MSLIFLLAKIYKGKRIKLKRSASCGSFTYYVKLFQQIISLPVFLRERLRALYICGHLSGVAALRSS